ncbi:hypothetical protein ACFYOD_35925 [Streptomyces sp. NPDC006703]|uniref:hypothetical protein n=1 Tax=Streptomyces sp. NPDC006703 TaxID=3364759 RepID=UPI00367411EE
MTTLSSYIWSYLPETQRKGVPEVYERVAKVFTGAGVKEEESRQAAWDFLTNQKHFNYEKWGITKDNYLKFKVIIFPQILKSNSKENNVAKRNGVPLAYFVYEKIN